MNDSAIIQAISAIMTALITAVASIAIAFIQKSKNHETEEPKIFIPSGIKINRRKRIPFYLIILFTVLGGALGYFISGSLATNKLPLSGLGDPFFVDDFPRLNNGTWEIENLNASDDSISVQDGKLYFDFTNSGKGWDSQYISAKNLTIYSGIEFETVILEASDSSTITFNTNCHGKDTGSLFVEIGWNSNISGIYEVYRDASVELVNLGWNESFKIGKSYTIFLHQDNNLVRAYINGVKMPTPFPCDNIGPNLYIGSTADKGHSIKGFIEYVKAWK